MRYSCHFSSAWGKEGREGVLYLIEALRYPQYIFIVKVLEEKCCPSYTLNIFCLQDSITNTTTISVWYFLLLRKNICSFCQKTEWFYNHQVAKLSKRDWIKLHSSFQHTFLIITICGKIRFPAQFRNHWIRICSKERFFKQSHFQSKPRLTRVCRYLIVFSLNIHVMACNRVQKLPTKITPQKTGTQTPPSRKIF